mmetsp:Transcript_17239/g.53981  ORF Transcript_17239/g.53981 Transcript_17239/m.53981 type:complete len:211 (+) Transcript_17239:1496-2128(+)
MVPLHGLGADALPANGGLFHLPLAPSPHALLRRLPLLRMPKGPPLPLQHSPVIPSGPRHQELLIRGGNVRPACPVLREVHKAYGAVCLVHLRAPLCVDEHLRHPALVEDLDRASSGPAPGPCVRNSDGAGLPPTVPAPSPRRSSWGKQLLTGRELPTTHDCRRHGACSVPGKVPRDAAGRSAWASDVAFLDRHASRDASSTARLPRANVA